MEIKKLLRKIFRKKKLKIIDISTGKNVSKNVELECYTDEKKGRDKNFTLIREDLDLLQHFPSNMHTGEDWDIGDDDFTDFTENNDNKKGSE